MHSVDDVLISMKMGVISDVFQSHYDGLIAPIAFDVMPASTISIFEGYSRRFILPKQYRERNFEESLIVTHKNGDITYMAAQTKIFNTDGDFDREKLFYLTDVDNSNNVIASAELRFNFTSLDSYFSRKLTTISSTLWMWSKNSSKF